jgi:hypothetical protein
MTYIRQIGSVLIGFILAFSNVDTTVWATDSTSALQVSVEQQVNGFRFSIEGENVSSIRTQLLALDGRTLFDSGWIAGQTVAWPMVTQMGRPAASGIYLYVIAVRDESGQERRSLGKIALLHGQESAFTVSSVGTLAGTEPAAAQFPLLNGTVWRQRLGADRSDTYRIQRKPARVPGGPTTAFENLLMLTAEGKLYIRGDLCSTNAFAQVTAQNPDNFTNGTELCLSSLLGTGGGGGSTPNSWTDDGAIVRLETTTDNVGVGTTNPGAKLEAIAAVGGVALMGTSDSRAIIGRLGNISCPSAPYAVGGCGGAVSGAGGVVGLAGPGGIGVLGDSNSRGIVGTLGGTSCAGTYAVGGCAGASGGIGVNGTSDTGIGVHGSSNTNRAVEGFSGTGIGVIGDSTSRGVVGTRGRTSCAGTYAVGACSADAIALFARTNTGSIFVGQAPAGTNQVRIDNTGKGFFNNGTIIGGADFAESMRTTDDLATLEPGDVLMIDPAHPQAVKKSRVASSLLVAGVYSTKPSVLSIGDHHIDDALEKEVPVAIVGIVPTKVTAENGPIHIGDLLVTSSTPGYAMKAKPLIVNGVAVYPTGAILGKALESLETGAGVIQVMVTLR